MSKYVSTRVGKDVVFYRRRSSAPLVTVSAVNFVHVPSSIVPYMLRKGERYLTAVQAEPLVLYGHRGYYEVTGSGVREVEFQAPDLRHPATPGRLTDLEVIELRDQCAGGLMPETHGWFLDKPHQMLWRALSELAELRGLTLPPDSGTT